MITNLLNELNIRGIKLSYVNGKLKYFGPEDQITPELLEKLKENKEYLIEYLCSKEKSDINENMDYNSLIIPLIRELDKKGIKLSYENGKLKYIGPEQNITSEILAKLKENKDNLIKYICSEKNSDINLNGKNLIPFQFDTFGELITYLQNNGYKFSIKNAKLIYDSPNQIQNKEIDDAIAKNYRHLFEMYWPLPNANLTPIQPEGQKEPFIIVHGEQATPFLQEAFGTDIPIFDYFHQSSDGSRMKYKKVEDIAEYYLKQLLSIKSDGDFYLGGYSFGGIVAYEMAQQLINMGKNVKLLVIIDTYSPNYNGYFHKYGSFKERLKLSIINPILDWVWSLIWKCQIFYNFKMGKPIPAKLRSFYIVDKYMRYSDCYQPKPYTNKLHMITAQSNMDTVDPYLGWRKFVKNKIELIHLPGNHREMVKNPEVAKMLAEKIKNIILNLK